MSKWTAFATTTPRGSIPNRSRRRYQSRAGLRSGRASAWNHDLAAARGRCPLTTHLILEDTPALHHKTHLSEFLHVLQRVAIHRNHVGVSSGGHNAKFSLFIQHLGGA